MVIDPFKPYLQQDTPELAELYDRESLRYQLPMGIRLLQDIALAPGEIFLDLGAGTGRLAAWAAQCVGPTGHVAALEPVPTRHAIAARNLKGLSQVSLHLEGARDLVRYPSNSFDLVCLNEVLQWIPDPEAALAELFRILKPHGRMTIFTSGPVLDFAFLKENDFAPLTQTLLKPDHIFTHLEPTLHSLRFRGISVRPFRMLTHFPNTTSAIDFLESSTFRSFLGRLPASLQPQARKRLESELETRRDAQGIPLASIGCAIVAIKPPPGPEALFRWWDLPIRRFFLQPRAVWAATLLRPKPKAPTTAPKA